MKNLLLTLKLALVPILVSLPVNLLHADSVVINEIMYHPASNTNAEEFIEILNLSSTNINLTGWHIEQGVDFAFPNGTQIGAGQYLVIAADTNRFRSIYPAVASVIGNWSGTLNNSRQTLRLVNSSGQLVDTVRYADEGDWAVRIQTRPRLFHNGWDWIKEPDGLGKSLELRNPALPNEPGQNWGPSIWLGGTPGQGNTLANGNLAPMILNAHHFPIIPRSTNAVHVVAEIVDESTSGIQAGLHYRIDSTNAGPFLSLPMSDDGLHQDGVAGDGIYGAEIPPATNDSVVEFYISARDSSGNDRTYPGPAVLLDGFTRSQSANLLYQVDDRSQETRQPLYKLIMLETERSALAQIGRDNPSGEALSNAEMNGTFISVDASGVQVRYLVGIRNRGHGSRNRQPNNYRVNFRTDDTWNGVEAINVNGQVSYMQHLGAVLSLQSGVAGAYAVPAQVRVNNADLSLSGGLNRTFGSYAVNETLNSDWAEAHFPFDSGGNLYRAIRDIAPGDLSYRGTNWQSYTNSYFKESNVAENDWSDLIHLTDVLSNASDADYERAVREAVNVDQWLRHLAVMALFDSRETGLNTGNGDDYFMYRGNVDPRFNLIFYDLDSILGISSSSTNGTIFGAAEMPVFARFLNFPAFRTNYFSILNDLINTTFSKERFDAVVDQTLGSYVPQSTLAQTKSWMDGRREYVRSQISASLPAPLPVATIAGVPRERTPLATATVHVGGEGVTHYKYQLNATPLSPEIAIASPIEFHDLSNGAYTLHVFGRNAEGLWQVEPTISKTWTVDSNWPGIRINEVLASNRSAAPRDGGFPDQIELFNESSAPINLSGYALAKGTDSSTKYFFAPGTTIAAGGYLVLTASDNPATSSNTGFALDAAGDQLVVLAPGVNSVPFAADTVVFGNQLPDLPIARVQGGDWTLTRPTLGTANVAEALAPLSSVVINEWLASPDPGVAEFVELFNRDALPVNIGGLFLTDQPLGFPEKQRIPDLTFIGARGFFLFSDAPGSAKLEFRLNASAGEIALLLNDSERIDSVAYTAERASISSGRTPDGAAPFAPFPQPTPGGPNSRPDLPVTAQLVTLLSMDHTWKYDQSGTNLGTSWQGTNYSDASWSSGPALLADEDSTLGEPIRTPLNVSSQKRTFYFRTKFTVDSSVKVSGLQATHYIDDGAVFYLNGQEVSRYNMAAGTVAFDTLASSDISNARLQGPFIWPAEALKNGENTLAVEVHQDRSSSSDIVFGLLLEGLVITNNPSEAGVMLNEILTQNSNLKEPDGSTPDWIELYNPSTNDLDLAGLALSDDPALARKWTFPVGSIIRAHQFLAIKCDASKPTGSTNTGFALQASGGALFLHGRESDGGELLDSIRYGLLPQDFSLGRDSSNRWTLNLPTIGQANVPANLGPQSALRINEWLANPTGGEDDWFELVNPDGLPIDLSGLQWSDDPALPAKSPIPQHSYIGIGPDRFIKFVADDNVQNGPNHTAFKLSSSADHILLSRPDGTSIDAVSFANQSAGISEGRLPDGSTQIVRFTDTISPGHPNFLLLTNVTINEILTHTDPPLEDAVEIFNPGAFALDLGGWFLSDDQDDPRKFTIPAGTVLAPNAFKVFYESQFNPLPGDPGSFSFSSAKGDSVILSEATSGGVLTGRRITASFGPAVNGISFGMIRTSSGMDYAPLQARTFGRDFAQTLEEFRLGNGAPNAAPRVGPMIISEIMFHPPALGTNDNVRDEFIELQNISGASVSLFDPAHSTNRWRLRGGVEFDLPAISVPAGGTLVIVSFDPQNDIAALREFQAKYGATGTLAGPFRGKLGNEDDTIELQKPDEPELDTGEVPFVLVEKVSYSGAAPWPGGASGTGLSLHRRNVAGGWPYSNEALNWLAQSPSPGVREGISAADQDGDGMPDDWEVAHGLNPQDPNDAISDADGDSLSNRTEFALGTDPGDASSTFKTQLAPESGGYVLKFLAREGHGYSVETRDLVGNGNWLPIAAYPAGSEREIVLPVEPTGATRFYRIVTP